MDLMIVFVTSFAAGVASASALPPRTFANTFGPLIAALAVAIVLGVM